MPVRDARVDDGDANARPVVTQVRLHGPGADGHRRTVRVSLNRAIEVQADQIRLFGQLADLAHRQIDDDGVNQLQLPDDTCRRAPSGAARDRHRASARR